MQTSSLSGALQAARPAAIASVAVNADFEMEAVVRKVAMEAAAAMEKLTVDAAAAGMDAATVKPSDHAELGAAASAATTAPHSAPVKAEKKIKASQLSVLFGLIGRDVETVRSEAVWIWNGSDLRQYGPGRAHI